jgi:hypothetical protein
MVGKTCWLCMTDGGGEGAGANSDEEIKSVDFFTSFFHSMTAAGSSEDTINKFEIGLCKNLLESGS